MAIKCGMGSKRNIKPGMYERSTLSDKFVEGGTIGKRQIIWLFMTPFLNYEPPAPCPLPPKIFLQKNRN